MTDNEGVRNGGEQGGSCEGNKIKGMLRRFSAEVTSRSVEKW